MTESKKDPKDVYKTFLSPVDKSQKYEDSQKLGYFSLGNVITDNSEKVSYTDRLNNFVQRFSQDLTFDSNQKLELLNCKKRFSQESRGSLRTRLALNFKVNTEERINESNESDVEEDRF